MSGMTDAEKAMNSESNGTRLRDVKALVVDVGERFGKALERQILFLVVILIVLGVFFTEWRAYEKDWRASEKEVLEQLTKLLESNTKLYDLWQAETLVCHDQ